MKVEINPDVEARLQGLVDTGQFPSIEAAVNYGGELLHSQITERDRKLADLRATSAASIAQGGEHSADDVRADLTAQRETRHKMAG